MTEIEKRLSEMSAFGGSDTIASELWVSSENEDKLIHSVVIIEETVISHIKFEGKPEPETLNYITNSVNFPIGTTIFFELPVIEITASKTILVNFYSK